MSKTPTKDSVSNFIPKELPTPTKDNNGVSKTIFTHISNLQSLLGDWYKLQKKGTKICKTILSLKLHEFQNDYFPHELKFLTEGLVQVVDGLENVLEGTVVLKKQINALAQLQKTDNPVMHTWTAKKISENVSSINDSLVKEVKLKKTILENVAHCRDEHLLEVYTSAWEYNLYFDTEKSSYLFIEFGMTI